MEQEENKRPLLAASFAPGHEPRVPVWTGEFPCSELEAQVTGSEIRAAAAHDPYPAWINACVVTPDSSIQGAHDPGYGDEQAASSTHENSSVQSLQEDEIRDLLIDHVHHHCCWGKRPAWSWKISKVEDCNAYVGTLETFIEERDLVEECVPYDGRIIDEGGRAPGPWELDTRSHFPPLFVSSKEALIKVPHSESVEQCTGCFGQGDIACHVCTIYDDSGNLQQRKKFTCSGCNGRGLIAHLDGSDSSCKECKGSGKVYCPRCHSRGLLACEHCKSAGSFVSSMSVRVKWRTLLSRKVIASSHAASVPDDVFQRAKGVELYCHESQQCQAADFQDSALLSRFSKEIIRERAPVPPAARVVSERHRITVVPVTRVLMSDGKRRWFKFYIVGLKKEVYLKNYPQKCCCQCCHSCTIM
ncbi:protein SSUH2 homolog [Selaginella moellendorffii]|nr:protein SSUH2 homolog [Selaginella moellendorffii]|eukprot:XP_002976865.2 protein SSUH2 homolog [Selaginella moellendorffii]